MYIQYIGQRHEHIRYFTGIKIIILGEKGQDIKINVLIIISHIFRIKLNMFFFVINRYYIDKGKK